MVTGTVCFAVQCGSNVYIYGSKHVIWPWFFGKLLTKKYCTEHVALFVLPYSVPVVLSFPSVDQTMQCDHSLESYRTVLYMYCGTVTFYHTVWFKHFHLWIKPCSVTILWKSNEQYCTVELFVLLYSVVITFPCVDQTMQCDHSLESY